MSEHDDPVATELFKRAERILAILKSQARRAFVVEFTGTPKAGKSTSVAWMQTFFKEAKYQVHLLKERAADCPLPMKGHFFFNAWTTATMLAEVLATYETDVDLLLLDRGFFDALVWLELQRMRQQVTDEEKRIFEQFVLLQRWRSLVDLTLIMSASPDIALERENRHQLLHRAGGMMNSVALTQFNEALNYVSREHGKDFECVSIDTTNHGDLKATNVSILERLLDKLEKWADPPIAVAPRKAVEAVFAGRPFLHGDEALLAFEELASQTQSMARSEAENAPDVVQFVSAAIHTHRDRLIVLERESDDSKAAEYGRHKLWVGCHMESPSEGGESLLNVAMACLHRRIFDDLHLARQPDLKLLGLVWDAKQKETQHLGIMFRSVITSSDVADHLQNKKFKRMGRSSRLTSAWLTQGEILTRFEEVQLESWSKHVVENVKLTETVTEATNAPL